MNQGKISKKNMFLLIVGIILAFFIIASIIFAWQYPRTGDFGKSGQFQKETVEAAATEIVGLFSEQEYDKIMADYAGEILLEAADAKDLEYVAVTVNSDWGAFREIKSIALEEMKKAGKLHAVSEVEAVYENVTVTYTFSFDEDMKLSGVYLR